MISVTLPEGTGRRKATFYLAMEEWVATNLPEGHYVFSWILEPTVVFGRNQLISAEVNLDYCRENAINVVRRKSGGGCVYADLDNVMFSYITPKMEVQAGFDDYTGMVCGMLRSLGVNAMPTGRNDIQIDGKKVAGNSYYRVNGRSIVHGTMLYNTNMVNMLNAITPSKSKLEAKHVQSVESRITTLHHYISMPIEEFEAYAIKHLTDSEVKLDHEAVAQIEEIERSYLTPQWLYGKDSRIDERRKGRVEGVGELDFAFSLAAGNVEEVCLRGDFFTLEEDLDRILTGALKGVPFDRVAFEKALAKLDLEALVAGLDANSLLNVIFPDNN